MATDLLLTYAMTTSPSPLQVSASSAEPSVASLTIIVSCPPALHRVAVTKITVALPVSDPAAPDATALALVAPPQGCASIVSTGGEQWTAAPGLIPGLFVFTPKSSSISISSQGLTINFTGIEISALVGTAQVTIREWTSASGAAPSPDGPPSAIGRIPVAKFPVGFFAENLDIAGSPEVESGATATLTWIGSSDASYEIGYGNTRVPVSGRSWTSPRLYTTTVFKLTASATQNGQTVSLSLSLTVQVASPIVVSVETVTDQIFYGDELALSWITTGADGVYLVARTVAGAHREQTWPAVSDPGHPTRFKPNAATSYELQAYRNTADGDLRSDPYPVDFAFAPLQIAFDAQPREVSDYAPDTTVSWQVAGAMAVTLQAAPVPASGTNRYTPKADTTYTLSATWVDGSVTVRTVTVRALPIQSGIFNTTDVRPWDQPQLVTSKAMTFLPPFAVAPTIALGLSQLDISNAANLRISADAANLSATGFTASLTAWADTVLYDAACAWLAVPAGDPYFQIGTFGGAAGALRILFPRAYSAPPKVVVWLRQLDMANNANVRINVSATDIDARGFTANIMTWADSTLYSAGLVWIAFPADTPGVVTGVFNPPGAGVTFSSFTQPPLVAVGLNYLDVDRSANFRIHAYAKDITAGSMNCALETWGGTTVWGAGAAYIAIGRTLPPL